MGIYLGLGANTGDRRKSLHDAIERLKQAGIILRNISPIYETPALLPEGAPGEWNKPYLNCVAEIETTLPPLKLLQVTQSIEKSLGRNHAQDRWSPRPVDVDILLWHDQIIDTPTLKIPHPEITRRAFVLDPLSWSAPSLKMPKTQQSILQMARSHPQHQPLLMGILNVNDDSFSDGGQHNNQDAFADSVNQWIKEGIHILDIGAELTRPGAQILTPVEEWERLVPYLDILKSAQGPLLSIDTYHPETAEKAINWGFNIINDVSGLSSSAMRALIKDTGTTAIAMHSLSVPADKAITIPPDADPVETLKRWVEEKMDVWQSEGIDLDKIIFDPGIGFSKIPHHSLEILRRLNEFADLPLRILVGHSRKSFMNVFSDQSYADRDWETVGLSLAIMNRGIDVIRVHKPLEHRRAIQAKLHIA